jgi:hypothetical protein
MLYHSNNENHSNVFDIGADSLFDFFEIRGRETSDFFELVREMGYTAVVHFMSDFSEVQLVIDDQFFDPLDFMKNDEMLNGDTFCFGKQLGHEMIVFFQFVT